MTSTLETLYTYASENRIPAYLVESGYRTCACVVQNTEEKLRRLLSTEGQELLEKYIAAAVENSSIQMEAAFQAGLSLGIELSRL